MPGAGSTPHGAWAISAWLPDAIYAVQICFSYAIILLTNKQHADYEQKGSRWRQPMKYAIF